MEKDFLTTLRRYGLNSQKTVLIACSGGLDSVAMVLLFVHTRVHHGLRLVLGHIDHGLRGRKEAYRDQKIIIEISKKYALPYEIMRCSVDSLIVPGQSVEALARIKRYELLRVLTEQHRCDYLALGHTQNDHSETVYMRLLQGYGLGGMRGIIAHREDIIRPLLHFTKQELLAYLKKYRQKWYEDSTNTKNCFLRNRLRKEIKKISLVNPRFEKSLLHLAQEATRYQEVYDYIMKGLISYQKMENGVIMYPLEIFQKQLATFQQGLIFHWFNELMRGLCDRDFRLPRRFVSSLKLDRGPVILRGYGILLKKIKEDLIVTYD